jgi:hypothetical protein
LTRAGVLLAVAVMGAAAGGLRAADTSPSAEPPDLSLVPADASGFVTARIAAIADKLGLKEARGLAVLANWQSGFAGVRTTDLERFSVIFMTPSEGVSVYRMAKACDREAVLKALAPEAKPVKRCDKIFHVNAAGAAVHFVSDRLFLYGPDKLVTEVVGKRGPEDLSRLAKAVRQATEHDVFVWSRAEEAEQAASNPAAGAVGRRKVTACKPRGRSSGGVPTLGELLQNQGALALWGDFPVPAGVEAADAFLDLGEKAILGARLYFTDEDSARSGAKLVCVGRDGARAMLLIAQTELSALDCLPELAQAASDDVDYAAIAALVPNVLPLIRPLEKALDRAAIEADGTTVPVVVTVPVNAKKVRGVLIAGLTWLAASGDGTSSLPFRAWSPGAVVPVAPSAPVAPPVCSPAGCLPSLDGPPPVPPPPGTRAMRAINDTTPRPITLGDPQVVRAANGAPVVSTLPAATSMALPPPFVAAAPTAPPAAGSGTVKLTVANVTKEPALLFSEGENGKLNFHRKVPAGEAVDVETTAGKRWVAVFAENPAGETHVAATADAPWLLRPASREPTKAAAAANPLPLLPR